MNFIANSRHFIYKAITLVLTVAIMVTLSTQLRADTGTCTGANVNLPFTDIQGNPFFCQIASAYFSGLTNGTTATTYSPGAAVAREQMAAFVSRTLDQSLKRGSRRAALDQWWVPKDELDTRTRGILEGDALNYVKSDGKDLWAVSANGVSRVDPITGDKTTYGPLSFPRGILIAMGSVFVAAGSDLIRINPKLSPNAIGAVTTVTSNLGSVPLSLAFDGKHIWTANQGGSISIIDPADNFSVITRSMGMQIVGILFDGNNIWVTDGGNGNLVQLDSFGFVTYTVVLGGDAGFPVFDGTNIWVPDPTAGKVYVVRAATHTLLATPQLNGAHNFIAAAFDGERVAVTDTTGYIHLWNAANLSYLGNCEIEGSRIPFGICSDGTRFWATMKSNNNNGELLGF